MVSRENYFPASKIFLTRIIKSDFLKNVLALMGGNAIAQLIAMGSAPIITRLFTPENFGLLALFTANLNIISKVSSLCYERAIVLPKKDQEAVNVFFLSTAILLIFTAFTFLVTLLFNQRIARFVRNPEFALWMWSVPIGILLAGCVNILRYWRMRRKEFKSIAYSKIWELSVSAITKISIGLLIGAYSGGLVLGSIMGIAASAAFLLLKPEKFQFSKHVQNVSKKAVQGVAKIYKQFPVFATSNALLNVVSQNLIVFMFSAFFNPVIVGFFSLGNRILSQPAMLLSTSIQSVYFQKTAQDLNNGLSLMPGLKKSTAALFVLGLLPFGLLTFYGKPLFRFVFGQDWETAGTYIQVMAPWFLFLFAASPANVFFEISQKQKMKLIITVSKAITVSVTIVAGCLMSPDPIKILTLIVVANILFETTTIVYSFYIAKTLSMNEIEVKG